MRRVIVKIYEEPELLTTRRVTDGYKPIDSVKIISDSFPDLMGGGTSKAENDAFSKLAKYVIQQGGNLAVVRSRHLSGTVKRQLEVIAEVYDIPSLSE